MPGGAVRIGIFDSGIGGLTVLAAARQAMPGHEIVYLGDTARIPYGTRSPLTVVRYSLAVASHLVQHERVEALVVACNTASTHALPALQAACQTLDIPVFGVVEPGVEAALEAHTGGAVAVLGTAGTVGGGAYQRALAARAPTLEVHAVPCPLFVPLVEEGWLHGDVPRQVAEAYVGFLRDRATTVILGCTHYPLLTDVLGEVLPGARLVDSAHATARAVSAVLGAGEGSGGVEFLVTDHVERFQHVGAHFLGTVPSPVRWVDLGPAVPPFTSP
ncbi:MAG: glutamate racemase [Alphaproteobacteria bacterium]|nr:glutamate racemase [Alphaproteobacteria bacterium]